MTNFLAFYGSFKYHWAAQRRFFLGVSSFEPKNPHNLDRGLNPGFIEFKTRGLGLNLQLRGFRFSVVNFTGETRVAAPKRPKAGW